MRRKAEGNEEGIVTCFREEGEEGGGGRREEGIHVCTV